METLSNEQFEVLLRRAGLKLDAEEARAMKAFFEMFQRQLAALHAADVGSEENALTFSPHFPARPRSV